MALFVLVGALVQVGVTVRSSTTSPTRPPQCRSWRRLVSTTATSRADSPLWWAFVFGAGLGGNATAVAAGAKMVVLGIAAKAGAPISFWGFTRYGVVVTVATLLVAWPHVYLRNFALAQAPAPRPQC
jgi:Na+/H+ antiporter NhaD/arsenite permease-like protein